MEMRINDPLRSTVHEKCRFKGVSLITEDEPLYRLRFRDETGRFMFPVFTRSEIVELSSKNNYNKAERNLFREALAYLDSMLEEKSAQETESSDEASGEGDEEKEK